LGFGGGIGAREWGAGRLGGVFVVEEGEGTGEAALSCLGLFAVALALEALVVALVGAGRCVQARRGGGRAAVPPGLSAGATPCRTE
jgi:hypothetical protein